VDALALVETLEELEELEASELLEVEDALWLAETGGGGGGGASEAKEAPEEDEAVAPAALSASCTRKLLRSLANCSRSLASVEDELALDAVVVCDVETVEEADDVELADCSAEASCVRSASSSARTLDVEVELVEDDEALDTPGGGLGGGPEGAPTGVLEPDEPVALDEEAWPSCAMR